MATVAVLADGPKSGHEIRRLIAGKFDGSLTGPEFYANAAELVRSGRIEQRHEEIEVRGHAMQETYYQLPGKAD